MILIIGKADSIYDAIKNALAVKSERKELIHDGMMGSGGSKRAGKRPTE